MKRKNQDFIALERRLSEDRRSAFEEEDYIGPERRTGIDARGGEKLTTVSKRKHKKESHDLDWLFGQGVHSTMQGGH